jgi:hypothetical protein
MLLQYGFIVSDTCRPPHNTTSEIVAANSIEAVEQLAKAASSTVAISAELVQKVASVAMANVKTPEGAQAVQDLAALAAAPRAGLPSEIENEVNTAVSSIE